MLQCSLLGKSMISHRSSLQFKSSFTKLTDIFICFLTADCLVQKLHLKDSNLHYLHPFIIHTFPLAAKKYVPMLIMRILLIGLKYWIVFLLGIILDCIQRNELLFALLVLCYFLCNLLHFSEIREAKNITKGKCIASSLK